MLTRDKLRETYDQLAPSYDQRTFVEDYIFGVKRLRRHVMRKASGKVLEVAAGTGKSFPHIASHDITAIDLSMGMLRVARQKAHESQIEVKAAVMGGESLGFPNRAFDTVLSSLSTCTFPDPISALGEMGRVKTDGRILLLEHGRSGYRLINRYLDRKADQHYQIIGCRWNQDPADLVQRAGLHIVSIKRYFFSMFYVIEAAH